MQKVLTLLQFQQLVKKMMNHEPLVEISESCFQMEDEKQGLEKIASVRGFSRYSRPGYEITFDWEAKGNLDGYLIDMFDFTIEVCAKGEFTPVFKGATVLDDYKEPFEGYEIAQKILEMVEKDEWVKWIKPILPEPRMLI